MTQEFIANIFLSYTRQSESDARTLVDDLEALGPTVWFDQDLSGGQVWWDQILATIRDCDVFVFVLDPKALASTACKREFGYAADLGKPILPVLVSGDVSTNLLPPALSRIQFVDYRKQDRDAALRLAKAIAIVPPPAPLPDPLPPPPKLPVSRLGSLIEQVETTSSLSFEKQSALVVNLKKFLRDPGTTDDTRALLERLRKRHDLLATIGEEIDELLASTRKASSVPLRDSATEPPQQEPPTIAPSVEQPQVTTQHAPSPSLMEASFAAQKLRRRPRQVRWIVTVATFLTFFVAGFGLGAFIAVSTNKQVSGMIGAGPVWLIGLVTTYFVWKHMGQKGNA